MTLWVRFTTARGRVAFGALEADRIIEYDGELFGSARRTGVAIPRTSVTLLSPCMPSKIVALWNNFHALAAKLNKRPPNQPRFLIKPGTSVAGPDAAIRRPPHYVGKITYEGELGIVIGKDCKEISASRAREFIFGYTCVNDVTAIDVLEEDPDFVQWCRSKGYDTFGCIGPGIASDFDWSQARVITTVDGVERQNYPLSDMVFSPSELVSRLSYDMTLLPGDVIACGTSVGVGSIRDGSRIEVSIEGIGSLGNTLSAAVAPNLQLEAASSRSPAP